RHITIKNIEFTSKYFPINQQTAIIPTTLVITICEMAPINIPITPKTLFLDLRKNTRPPYSPIRLGVKTAQDNPENTDSIAFLNPIGSKWLHINFHLSASVNQFINISTKITKRVM